MQFPAVGERSLHQFRKRQIIDAEGGQNRVEMRHPIEWLAEQTVELLLRDRNGIGSVHLGRTRVGERHLGSEQIALGDSLTLKHRLDVAQMRREALDTGVGDAQLSLRPQNSDVGLCHLEPHVLGRGTLRRGCAGEALPRRRNTRADRPAGVQRHAHLHRSADVLVVLENRAGAERQRRGDHLKLRRLTEMRVARLGLDARPARIPCGPLAGARRLHVGGRGRERLIARRGRSPRLLERLGARLQGERRAGREQCRGQRHRVAHRRHFGPFNATMPSTLST